MITGQRGGGGGGGGGHGRGLKIRVASGADWPLQLELQLGLGLCDWDIYAKQPPCCLRPLWAPLAPPVWSRLDACSMHCWQQRQPDSSSQSETETASGSGSLTVFALADTEEDTVLLTLLLPSIYGHHRRGT